MGVRVDGSPEVSLGFVHGWAPWLLYAHKVRIESRWSPTNMLD